MVHKNVKISDVEGITLIESGLGTLQVTTGITTEGIHSLVIRGNEYIPVGQESKNEEGTTTDDFKPDVMFLFHNEEGLDVILEYLLEIK
jgi:hypothetical protein